jgi:hypothetical protein
VKLTAQHLFDAAMVLLVARWAVRELASDHSAYEMIQNLELGSADEFRVLLTRGG